MTKDDIGWIHESLHEMTRLLERATVVAEGRKSDREDSVPMPLTIDHERGAILWRKRDGTCVWVPFSDHRVAE